VTTTESDSPSSSSSSSDLVNDFTYVVVVNVSTASSTPLHPTSTAVSDRLTSSATETVTIGHRTSRDPADMHMHYDSLAVTSRSSPVTVPSNASEQTSVEVPTTSTNTTVGVPTSSGLPDSGLPDDVTSSGLPDDVTSAYDVISTIPDVDALTSTSVPDVTVSPEYFRPSPFWTTVLAAVLCLLGLVVLLVILVVCLARARARHKLCWTKHRCYLPVPLFYQNGSRTAVVLDASASTSGSATTVGNCLPAKGPELAPLTRV